MKSILDYFEDTVRAFPEKVAFADEKSFCTYKELEERAKRIASFLLKKVKIGRPVPVFMEKSVDTIAVLLGSVYAGAFYAVLDIKHPQNRLESILQTLDSDFFFSVEVHRKEAEVFAEEKNIYWFEEAIQTEIDEIGLQNIRTQIQDTLPLYCNFTSGSTGVPKGVLVSHRSVMDFIGVFTETFHITEEDVIGNQAPWDFDVSVKDIYSALFTGATVQIIPRKCFSFPTTLMDFLCERQVTTLIWAVSALCIITTLKGFDYKVPETIRKVMFSGEVMPIKHLNLWKKHLPEATYVNLYGPTEITCNCTYYPVDREFEEGEILPIGNAFANEKVFLLNEEEQEVTEAGVEGEICV